jgi:hypothetical protein
MKKIKPEYIEEWEEATENLKEYFVDKYFKDAEYWWVADEVGGVLYVNDYFFDLADVVDYIRYNYPRKKMFEYYEYQLKCDGEGVTPINIKNYISLPLTWIKNNKRV